MRAGVGIPSRRRACHQAGQVRRNRGGDPWLNDLNPRTWLATASKPTGRDTCVVGDLPLRTRPALGHPGVEVLRLADGTAVLRGLTVPRTPHQRFEGVQLDRTRCDAEKRGISRLWRARHRDPDIASYRASTCRLAFHLLTV